MNAAFIHENTVAKQILAGLKSGAPQTGIVRSHSKQGSTTITWIRITLPDLGERTVALRNQPELHPGQQVVIQCVTDPEQPNRFIFRLMDAGSVHTMPGTGARITARHSVKALRFHRVRL